MIKKCPKCLHEFDDHSKWGPKKFCSRKCANSRTRTKEIKEKISKSVENFLETHPRQKQEKSTSVCLSTKNKINRYKKKSVEEKKHNKEISVRKLKETKLAQYLATPFNQLGSENRRRRVFEEQNFSCSCCGIDSWQGEKLPLELDHIDGDNQNNKRDNLRALCPNCHSLTSTWRGRNKRISKIISDDEFKQALSTNSNTRQALLYLGLSAKGGNYKRANTITKSK
jgi:hypothetical protein